MNNIEEIAVKKFKLPGLEKEFLMAGEFVFRADNHQQAFYRDDDGKWIVIRKAFVEDPEWIAVLEATYAR